jgi:hypothetical protein
VATEVLSGLVSSPIFADAVRAFTVSGKMKPEEAVVATLSSLPDEVVDTVGTVLPSEDSVSERKRKLEFLEMQEELIKVCIQKRPRLLHKEVL